MEPRNQIDQWLDEGLAEYSHVVPRVGLENRILANLSAERNRISDRRRWWWTLGAVSAMTVVAASVWIESRPNDRMGPASVAKAAGVQLFNRTAEPPVQMSSRSRSAKPPNGTVAAYGNTHFRRTARVNSAKLDQFPSAPPLSGQMALLVEYVNITPRDEIIAAIAHAEDTGDLQIKNLEIPPLDRKGPASESSQTN